VIHVLSGSGVLKTSTGDHAIGAGDTAIVPSGERHQTVNSGQAPLVLVCAFPVADIRPATREFEGWEDG
jgi:quercetin dioxygenase-like cupin family protein